MVKLPLSVHQAHFGKKEFSTSDEAQKSISKTSLARIHLIHLIKDRNKNSKLFGFLRR